VSGLPSSGTRLTPSLLLPNSTRDFPNLVFARLDLFTGARALISLVAFRFPVQGSSGGGGIMQTPARRRVNLIAFSMVFYSIFSSRGDGGIAVRVPVLVLFLNLVAGRSGCSVDDSSPGWAQGGGESHDDFNTPLGLFFSQMVCAVHSSFVAFLSFFLQCETPPHLALV